MKSFNERMSAHVDNERSEAAVDAPRLVRCWGCEGLFDERALFTVDVEEYGTHTTKEVCEECMREPDKPRIDDETHWTETHGTPDGGGC